MHGTSIGDLNKNLQDMTQVHYNANQNMHYEQGHNAAHHMHQAQQMPYYTMPNTLTPAQGYLQQSQDRETLDIEELAKDINESLPEETFAGVSDMENNVDSSIHLLSSIPSILREPIIILILFIILSQPGIKDTIGKYITSINPDAECKVSFTGVLIYGIILAALFALAKKFIL